ncbi:MAG: hypothetical protein LBB86_08880 [Oscillospiraceae bacterium]|jgi:hypothetical protein|nr:hypothetical protein [Oscillospiraceae bacterium]
MLLLKRFIASLLAVCSTCALCLLLGATAASARSSAFLSPEALKELRPDYELFLESMSDTLIENGLLAQDDKENWIAFHLADFIQNGGYGTIAIMYNPDLLMNTDSDSLALRLTASIGAGVMHLDTLRAFTPGANNLPGLPLEVALETETGEPIACIYRWTAAGGVLKVWDRISEAAKSVGSEWIGSDQTLYWYDDAAPDAVAQLAIEFISLENGESLGTYRVNLTCNEERWRVADDAN